jgi:hypothetical protein
MTTNDCFPPAHYAVFSNPLPGKEADLDRWYEDIHIPDSLDAGLFDSVRRYRSCSPASARFLTLWGCGYADTDAALAAVRPVAEGLRTSGRIEVVQEVVFQEFVFLDRVYRDRPASDSGSKWLTTTLSCWAEPSSLKEFEEQTAPAFAAALADDSDSAVSGMAQYGHRGERARAIVLTERDRPMDRSVPIDSDGNGIVEGLPPFGDAVPIFPGGSPAPSPIPSEDRASRARAAAAWVADWECISQRFA